MIFSKFGIKKGTYLFVLIFSAILRKNLLLKNDTGRMNLENLVKTISYYFYRLFSARSKAPHSNCILRANSFSSFFVIKFKPFKIFFNEPSSWRQKYLK